MDFPVEAIWTLNKIFGPSSVTASTSPLQGDRGVRIPLVSTMKIELDEILNFYERPLVFTATDSKHHNYICYINDVKEDGTTKYFGKRVSQKILNKYLKGDIDLRSIFKSKIINLYMITEDNSKYYTAVPYIKFIKEELLPGEGFFNK